MSGGTKVKSNRQSDNQNLSFLNLFFGEYKLLLELIGSNLLPRDKQILNQLAKYFINNPNSTASEVEKYWENFTDKNNLSPVFVACFNWKVAEFSKNNVKQFKFKEKYQKEIQNIQNNIKKQSANFQPLIPLANLYEAQIGSNAHQIIIQANGNGNCFYYSLVLNFLYQAAFSENDQKNKAILGLNKIFNQSLTNTTENLKVNQLIEDFKAKKLTQFDINPIAAQTKTLYSEYLIYKICYLKDPFFDLSYCKKTFTGHENATIEELTNAIRQYGKTTNYDTDQEDFLRHVANDQTVFKDITTYNIFGITCNTYRNTSTQKLQDNDLNLINQGRHFDALIPTTLHQKATQYWARPTSLNLTEIPTQQPTQPSVKTTTKQEPFALTTYQVPRQPQKRTATTEIEPVQSVTFNIPITARFKEFEKNIQDCISTILNHPKANQYAPEKINQLLDLANYITKLTEAYIDNPKTDAEKQESCEELKTQINEFLTIYESLSTNNQNSGAIIPATKIQNEKDEQLNNLTEKLLNLKGIKDETINYVLDILERLKTDSEKQQAIETLSTIMFDKDTLKPVAEIIRGINNFKNKPIPTTTSDLLKSQKPCWQAAQKKGIVKKNAPLIGWC